MFADIYEVALSGLPAVSCCEGRQAGWLSAASGSGQRSRIERIGYPAGRAVWTPSAGNKQFQLHRDGIVTENRVIGTETAFV